MRVRLLDFEHRTISIDHSKNGDARTVKMTQEVFELLKACCKGKGEDDFVFTRENDKPVRDFRESWQKVTEAAGVPGLLIHDLRRTGAHNMRRTGVDRDVRLAAGKRTASSAATTSWMKNNCAKPRQPWTVNGEKSHS